MSAADNIRAGIKVVRKCEGTDSPDGYRALFGYDPIRRPSRVFDNGFAAHPNIKFPFTQTDGTLNYTTAAGAYQIINATAVRLAGKLGLTDFTPASQDLMAIELIAEAGALLDLEDGDFRAFIEKCSAIWASLPASHYLQPKVSMAFALSEFGKAGGTVA